MSDHPDKQGEASPVLEVRSLTKHFPVRGKSGHVVHAVDGVSFAIPRKKTLGLVGESGCGKSTCARTIIRIYDPTQGQILLDGTDISAMDQKTLLPYRKKMQMIFQDPYASLNARMTVHDIIAEPLRAHHMCQSRREESDMVYDMLENAALLRFFTPLRFFPFGELLQGELNPGFAALSLLLSAAFGAAAFYAFTKKDLQ